MLARWGSTRLPAHAAMSAIVLVCAILSSCNEPVAVDRDDGAVDPVLEPARVATPAVEGAWDFELADVRCRASTGPLLDAALASAGLTRSTFGLTDADFAESAEWTSGRLGDVFRLPWLDALRKSPIQAGCIEGSIVAPLDRGLSSRHPVASMIRHAARVLGQRHEDQMRAPFIERRTFGNALDAICETLAAESRGRCGESSGELPNDLADALAPVVFAVREGLVARFERDRTIAPPHDRDFWQLHGGSGLLPANARENFNVAWDLDRRYLEGGRERVYDTAALIAYVIEDVKWSAFRDRLGVRFDVETPAGWIRVRDGSNETHSDDGDVLLFLDLGGDDVHLHGAGGNGSGLNAVSVAIDLSGRDRYGYEGSDAPSSRVLPADADGRLSTESERFGAVSLSNRSRQGGARNGIALLFDLGEGDDAYVALRASQGYAHQGVGVLFDAGGNDTYVAEAAAQGAAQFGIALSIDAGAGADTRTSFFASQGFGFVGGAGFLVDGGGDDRYVCDEGDPEHGGTPLYFSAQLPKKSNTSFCQGAGWGWRSTIEGTDMSGGIGVLRDHDGDDRYEASVYAQGVGYWQGIGLFSDGDGDDAYDALWYARGAAVHYGGAIFADSGAGADRYGASGSARTMTDGAGHDFGLGVFIDDGGADDHRFPALAGGAGSCNGLGLFIDNGGDDRYAASNARTAGYAEAGECATRRPRARSIGLMIDASGADAYAPRSEETRSRDDDADEEDDEEHDDACWSPSENNASTEHRAVMDAVGETGIHPESACVASSSCA